MADIVAALVSLLLVQPLQAELSERLSAARAPQAVVAEVAACARAAAPTMAQRAWGDPWWAASTVVQVWIGKAKPEAVLREAAPACGPALRSAAPYLTGQGA